MTHPSFSDVHVGLLWGLIDHAPTFPPAQLGLEDALVLDEQARTSGLSFMLGRLVWPMSLVGELHDLNRNLSVVLDAQFVADPRIEAVEVRRTDDFEDLPGLSSEVYVELPIDEDLEARVAVLSSLGLHAKVRCGGEVVPSVAELARFIRACREHEVAFKATAGLHHAVARDGAHGFLNLLAAAVFGHEDEVLAETDPSAFTLDGATFGWRELRSEPGQLDEIRRTFFRSIGSCSFFEPVEELQVLGLLPA